MVEQGKNETVGAVAVDALAFLKEAIGFFGDLAPSVGVEGDAHEEFRRWNTGVAPGCNGAFDSAAVVAEERSEEAGGIAPWTDEIIGHEADLIDEAGDGGDVGAGIHVWRVAHGDSEEEARTDGVHLEAKFVEQSLEVSGVRFMRVLPVDVDAVEKVRRGDAGSKVSFDEGVDAGGDEGPAIFRLGVEGEVGGAAFERDENAKVRESSLE